MAISLGNSTHKYIQHETVSCCPKSVSYQLYWRRRDHCPNICQEVLRTALTGSINRASFCFIFRWCFLISHENSSHCSHREKTILPGVLGNYRCVSLFAVSWEICTTISQIISSFPDPSIWLALCFVQMPAIQETHLCFSLLISYCVIESNFVQLVTHANKGNVRSIHGSCK